MAAPPSSYIQLRRWHHLLHPFFHFLGRYVFDVCRNAPQMAKRILNEAGTVSVELVLNRLQDFRALSRRALNHAIDVGKVNIEAYRAGADGGRAGIALPHAWIFVGQHDVRVADLQLGMTDLAVRTIHANGFSRSEYFLVILNRLRRTFDDEVWRDGVVIFGH